MKTVNRISLIEEIENTIAEVKKSNNFDSNYDKNITIKNYTNELNRVKSLNTEEVDTSYM